MTDREYLEQAYYTDCINEKGMVKLIRLLLDENFKLQKQLKGDKND